MTSAPLLSPEDASKLEEIRSAIREGWQASRQLRRRLTIGFPAALAPTFVDMRSPLALVMFVITGWALWPLLRILRDLRRRKPAIALWLRRFHDTRHASGVHRFLEGVVGPWGQMVTLADEAVRMPFFAFYGFSTIVLFVYSILLISAALRGRSLAPFVVMAVVMVLAVVALSRWRSVFVIETREQIPKLTRHVRQIRS